jgi:hypothetical protein
MRIVVATLSVSLVWARLAVAQVPISCEGWMEIHDQRGKLATEIRSWIVQEMRSTASRLARDNPGVLCANLECFKDGDLLAELNGECTKRPGRSLDDVASDTAFILYAMKTHDELKRQIQEENSN